MAGTKVSQYKETTTIRTNDYILFAQPDLGTNAKISVLHFTNSIFLSGLQTIKPSFYSNYNASVSEQFYCMNGTNQLVTMPDATVSAGRILRFSCTNANAIWVLTNFNGAQTMRDGFSLSYTNVGVNEVGFISDGSAWWLASKGKIRLANASWSCSTNITFPNVTNMVTLDTPENNNGIGIGLDNSAWFTPGVGSRIWITNQGQYMITFSAMWSKVGGGSANGDVWLRQDGVIVPRTATIFTIQNATSTNVMTVNFIMPVTKTTYFDLVGACPDGSALMQAMPAVNSPFQRPAAPSIIVTVNKVSD